jgi:hypothetical protein
MTVQPFVGPWPLLQFVIFLLKNSNIKMEIRDSVLYQISTKSVEGFKEYVKMLIYDVM